MHMDMYMYMYVYIYICIYVCVCAILHICVCIYIYMYIHLSLYIQVLSDIILHSQDSKVFSHIILGDDVESYSIRWDRGESDRIL